MGETILLERGPVTRITLNRPDRLNSFTADMHADLREALADVDEAREIGRASCRERV